MPSNTPNRDYNRPDAGVSNWNTPLNENFTDLDTDIQDLFDNKLEGLEVLDSDTVVNTFTALDFGEGIEVIDNTDGSATLNAQSSGNPRQVSGSTPAVNLADTDELILWRGTAPSNSSFEVYSGSVSNTSGNAPSGLKIVLENITDSTTTDLITSTYETGSPISSTDVGGDDLVIKLVNTTGSPQTTQADIGGRLE